LLPHSISNPPILTPNQDKNCKRKNSQYETESDDHVIHVTGTTDDSHDFSFFRLFQRAWAAP
jgi:hypothetical protein